MQKIPLNYQHNGINFKGIAVYDETLHPDNIQRPAVLIAHDWTGLNDFAQLKAERLARLGYVGVALDMYGEGRIGETKEEKMALMSPLMEDRRIIAERMQAGLNAAKNLPMVDPQKTAAIGFCFGGLCALDLARSGADVSATVSFHGLLGAPQAVSKTTIRSKILVLHGYDDPMVPPEQVNQFAEEMINAKADWQIHIYGNTMHAFTNPVANDPDFGTVYNGLADKRSWETMVGFLKEIFS